MVQSEDHLLVVVLSSADELLTKPVDGLADIERKDSDHGFSHAQVWSDNCGQAKRPR